MEDKIVIFSGGNSFDILPKISEKESLRKKSIETTYKLLETENIDLIIYIDDKFDVEGQKDEFVGRMKKLRNEGNHFKEGPFKDFEWDGPEGKISMFWDKSDKKQILLTEVCKLVDDNESPNVVPALEIIDHFKDKMITMTPDQWIEDDYEVLHKLNPDKRALCLFDFEFQYGNKLLPGRDGAYLTQILLDKKELNDKVICGIFSHKFTEEEEDSKRLEYAETYNIDKNKFYTISKFRYYYDPLIAGFAEGIKNLLLLSHIESLKSESLSLLKETHNEINDRISDITPKTFNQIIQKSSLKEGVWEISTLFRLYGILSKEENYNRISDETVRENFNTSIKKIREIDLQDTGYKSDVTNQQLIDLRNSELYLSGDIVNKLYMPLSNGDFFTIKNKEYILLVQPCNLALRASKTQCGQRSVNYNNAFLIPLRYFKRDELNHTKQEVYSIDNTPDKTLCAYFPEFKVLSLSFLDLTIFSRSGKAELDMNIDKLENDVIHFPWKIRYENIYKEFEVIEENINSYLYLEDLLKPKLEELRNKILEITKDFKDISKEEKDIKLIELEPIKAERKEIEDNLNSIKNQIFYFDNLNAFSLNNIANYNNETRVFSFDIERVRHYKSPYSDDLLQKFMQYLSRNAFDHDFTT